MKKIVWLLISFCCLTAAGQKPFFTGKPNFNNLNPNVIFNPIFKAAPDASVSQMQYVAEEMPSGVKYSDYTIFLDKRWRRMTQYHTVEIAGHPGIVRDPDHSVIRGAGVGHGGIFSLAYLKQQVTNETQHQGFHKKYEITDFTEVEGHLFPLKVGHELRLAYKKREHLDRHGKTLVNGVEHGYFVYRVTEKFKGYVESQPAVPGDIYVIQVRHASDSSPVELPMFEYWYAEKLGWYVATRYYKEGEVVARYHLVAWQGAVDETNKVDHH